jgi:hypothetical protein
MMSEYEAIETLFWEEWDPIGLHALGGGQPDEYDSYAKEVYSMLSKGTDADSIAHYLNFVANELIGVGADEELNIKIARRVVAIHASRSAD